MTFESNFCSSPWLHLRLNAQGHYEFCRWAERSQRLLQSDITSVAPDEYFQSHMASVRKHLLDGETVDACVTCRRMEQHHKVSGREKQLLKVGVRLEQFSKTMASSPWLPEFVKSQERGHTDLMPQDWQIDLGNHCNSACVFCSPESSSRLATEFVKIGLRQKLPPQSWTQDPALVSKFIDSLSRSSKLKYLHFIGGETLITPAFAEILKSLIAAGLHRSAVLGFTTNLTVWDSEIVDLLTEFQSVHLGVSVECFHPVNDYVRWPSKIQDVETILSKWLHQARQQNWLVQIRATPTLLSVPYLLTVYDFAWQNHLTVESCNFLEQPDFLRPSVLPAPYRRRIIDQMQTWLEQHQGQSDRVVNIRNPNFAQAQIRQDLSSYVSYFQNEPDESHRLGDLVRYLQKLDNNRKNSVLDYLPEYEELFRTAGYQSVT